MRKIAYKKLTMEDIAVIKHILQKELVDYPPTLIKRYPKIIQYREMIKDALYNLDRKD